MISRTADGNAKHEALQLPQQHPKPISIKYNSIPNLEYAGNPDILNQHYTNLLTIIHTFRSFPGLNTMLEKHTLVLFMF